MERLGASRKKLNAHRELQTGAAMEDRGSCVQPTEKFCVRRGRAGDGRWPTRRKLDAERGQACWILDSAAGFADDGVGRRVGLLGAVAVVERAPPEKTPGMRTQAQRENEMGLRNCRSATFCFSVI
jgi:hypothetical protein